MGRSDARQFYDQAAAALSGYLTDKFGMTEIELTGDNLESALSEKSIPREIVEETRSLSPGVRFRKVCQCIRFYR